MFRIVEPAGTRDGSKNISTRGEMRSVNGFPLESPGEAGRRRRYVAHLIKHFGETPLAAIDQAAIDAANNQAPINLGTLIPEGGAPGDQRGPRPGACKFRCIPS